MEYRSVMNIANWSSGFHYDPILIRSSTHISECNPVDFCC